MAYVDTTNHTGRKRVGVFAVDADGNLWARDELMRTWSKLLWQGGRYELPTSATCLMLAPAPGDDQSGPNAYWEPLSQAPTATADPGATDGGLHQALTSEAKQPDPETWEIDLGGPAVPVLVKGVLGYRDDEDGIRLYGSENDTEDDLLFAAPTYRYARRVQ